MKIKFNHWKDRRWHRGCGRTLYKDVRRFWLWVGPNCLGIEIHGMGPNP